MSLTDKEVVLKFCNDRQLSEWLLFVKAAEHFQYSQSKMMFAFKDYLFTDNIPSFIKQYIIKEMNDCEEIT